MIVPFIGVYRPLWVGLGAVALDLLLAVVLTSLIRARLGLRIWRGVHWLAYLAWPVAVAHGLGMGTDAGRSWMLAISGVCIASVLLAGALRCVVPQRALVPRW